MSAEPGRPLVSVRGVSKRFGEIEALRDVSLEITAGSVTAVLGDNGAGKSTLLKVISGALQPDMGAIFVDSRPVRFPSPKAANDLGIETVYQDLALCDNLSILLNIFLGRERRLVSVPWLGGLLAFEAMQREAIRLLTELAIDLPPVWTEVDRLSGGQRQAVAIARALLWGSRLLLLDEPTAALGAPQSDKLRSLIRTRREQGVGVLLITHNLDEAFRIADRFIIMRHGRVAATLVTGNISSQEVLREMTGASSGAQRHHG
jgi:D-xylose transport system ATP-binding protein